MTFKTWIALFCASTILPASVPIHAQRVAASTIEGEIEVLVADHDTQSQTHHFIKANGVRRELRFRGEPPVRRTGDRVRVRGVLQSDGALQLGTDDSSIETLTAVSESSTGDQSTLVLLVNFQDDPRQPYSVADAEAVMAQVSNHYWLGSYEQTTLTSTVAGWFTIAYNGAVCDPSSIASLADQAAANSGIDLAAYARRMYAFPDTPACSWWGLGTVGGHPSSAWINGSFARKVVGHELGHNFGLTHARARDCGAAPIGGTCSDLEYGNTIDIMGNPSSGNFNLFAKERLGWVNAGASPPLTVVTESAPYSISPYEALDARSKGLRILRSVDGAGVPVHYYVEFRQPVGNDAFLASNANVTAGVVISLGSSGNNSLLLDMTPETASWSDPALAVGKVFTDPETGLRIETLSANATGATVMVTLAGAAPSATVSLSSSAPRTSDVLTAAASAFDADGNAVTLTYAWKVNGVVKRSIATSSLSDSFDLGVPGHGDPGDTIAVDVTPFDGSLTGRVSSASVTVVAQKKRR